MRGVVLALWVLALQASWTAIAGCPEVNAWPLRASPGLLPWAMVVAAGLSLLRPSWRAPTAVGAVTLMTAHDLALRAFCGHWCAWTEWPWLLARALAAGAALALARRWPVRFRAAAVALGALPLVVALGWGWALALCLTTAKHASTGRADAAVVLGLSLPSDGRCPPGLASRAARGAELFREGRVRWVLLTGGAGDAPRPEADAAAEVVLARGVPEGAVLRERRSRTTRENLFFSAAILRAHGVRSVLVVSDPDHLARALQHARDAGIDARGEPVATAEWRDPRTATYWVLREASMLARDAGMRAVGMRVPGRL